MTCIAGIVEADGTVRMAGDSLGVASLDVMVRKDPKVFRRGEMLFGFTSSYRMGQLLMYKLEMPMHPPEIDAYEYMVKYFVESARKCLKDGGLTKISDNVDEAGTFMVGYRSRLFVIHNDFQVEEAAVPFASVGCGSSYALGALNVAYLLGNLNAKGLALAMETAETFSGGVRAPFNYVYLTQDLNSGIVNT